MNRSIKIKVILSSSLIVGILFLMQNCGTPGSVSHQLPPSPFEENKILLSEEFAAQQKLVGPGGTELLGTAVIPQATELSVIVKDRCIRKRQKTSNRAPFWIDNYINAQTPLGDETDFYSETAIGVITKAAFTVNQLNNYAKLDPCLVGISNTLKIQDRSAMGATATTSDLETALQFVAGDAIFASKIPSTVKVRVAILDSGLDHTNTSLTAKVDTSQNTFFNFLGTMVGATASQGNQDVYGAGTQLASLIVGDSVRGVKGLAERNVILLPIKIRNNGTQKFENYHYLNMIKLAVNMKADVINLGTTDVSTNGCDPLVGHAMLQAIRKNAFIVLSAGDNVEVDPSKPKRAGSFLTVKDNGPLFQGSTVAPSCWGRYLKGAIAVGASNTPGSALASFSNWGEDAVEIAAPGIAIRSLNHNKSVVNSDSILLPTAMVSAAAAMTIAYHKAQTWSYDPWLIEDIMLNSLPTKTTLQTLVRRGKFLSFASLASYLQSLELKTSAQRLAEQSDNAELNGGWNSENAVATNLLAIDVYAKNPLIQQGRRIQLNTVAYYTDAVIKVITEAGTTYSSSNTAVAEVNAQGVVVAKAPGSAIIRATYQSKTATASISIVDYDVIDGPNNEMVDLDISSTKLQRNNCPVMQGGPNSSTFPKAFAVYGDGGRTEVSHLTSFAAPSPPEALANSAITWGNWYGGKTYTLYGLYKGKQAKTDIIAPKAPLLSTKMVIHARGVGINVLNQQTVSVSQDKTIALFPYFVTQDCDVLGAAKGDTQLMKPYEIFTSTDPTLNQKLQGLSSWAGNYLDLYALTPGKTYQINAKFGTYRGNGTDQIIPPQTYFIRITPPDIQNIHLYQYSSVLPAALPLGNNNGIQIHLEDSAGQKVITPITQFAAEFIERGTGRKLKAPEAFVGYQTDVFANIMLFPSIGQSMLVDMVLTHLPTGFKKTFNFTASGLNRYAGGDMNAQPFSWTQFNLIAQANLCAQGATTPLAGNGSTLNPYVVCSAQQMIDLGGVSTDVKTAPNVVLGRPVDFGGVIIPKNALTFGTLDGRGFAISNIVYASADETRSVFIASRITNLELSDFSLSTRSITLLSAVNYENIRFVRGIVLANNNYAHLMSSASAPHFVTMKSIKNIRVDSVELQAMNYMAPIGHLQNARVENFGARNLMVRGSSVPGMGGYAGGISSYSMRSTIVSSSTSGTMAQVSSNVGGITGILSNSKLIAVTSNMNIAATSGNIGGLVGDSSGAYAYPVDPSIDPDGGISLIYKSAFSGQVRGAADVGGIAGKAENTTLEHVNVAAVALVQGTGLVGGLIGNSVIFNRFFDSSVDANLYSANSVHPLANATTFYSFRSADRFANLQYKGAAALLNPAMIPQDLPPNSAIGVMPLAPTITGQTASQLGLSFNVQGATISNGIYNLNLGSVAKGTTPIHRDVNIAGTSPFHIVAINNTASVAFTGGVTLGAGGTGYTNWKFGIGLPTNTAGSFNKTNSFLIQTTTGRVELKIQVIGTVTP